MIQIKKETKKKKQKQKTQWYWHPAEYRIELNLSGNWSRPTIAASFRVMAEEAAKMQIGAGFLVFCCTRPSDGVAGSGGKVRVNESNSDLYPWLECEPVLGMVRLKVFFFIFYLLSFSNFWMNQGFVIFTTCLKKGFWDIGTSLSYFFIFFLLYIPCYCSRQERIVNGFCNLGTKSDMGSDFIFQFKLHPSS